MIAELIAHSVLSCLSGLSVSVTGFGCDISRELLHLVLAGDDVFAPASAINMGLAAALVTAVQVTHQLICSLEQEICCLSPSLLLCLSLSPLTEIEEQSAARLYTRPGNLRVCALRAPGKH